MGDGLSAQTRRALLEQGESAYIPAAPAAPAAQVPAVGGPSPSREMLMRIEANRQKAAQESLQRLLEARRRAAGVAGAAPSGVPEPLPLTPLPRQ